MGKIFISHSSANNAEALAIHDWLAENGWGDVFLDLDPRRGLVAGDRWQAALKAAAEQCELILILISPDWAKSKWCLAEFLLAKQMNKQILGVVVKATPLADLPIELTAEWQLVDLSAADAGWSVTVAPPRFEPETTVSFSGTGLARLRSGLEKAGLDATTFNWPPADDPNRAPYRGLLPLEAEDAGIFYGRDGAIILTLDALRGLAAEAPPRFATILGASGAGKSSFLRAGLLPRLSRDSRRFQVLPIVRPGRAALTGEYGLAAMLDAALRARTVTLNRADIRAAVTTGASAVAPLLARIVETADRGDAGGAETPALVLAVDQAEELLTADNAEAGPFLTLLAALGKTDAPKLLVIFTVRSDSFDQLQSRPELAATQPHHLVDLPPVPAGSFGDIIRGPARRVTAAGRKLVVEETLVDALLGDIETGGAKDALPLLAFTLERLFTDYGADGDLQLSEYEKLGRIRGAIEAAVERALQKADDNPAIPRDRNARFALLRRGLIPWLAGIDPATGSPRRRVARLAEVPAEALPLIKLMVDERLLSTDIDENTKEQTIEPAHEALLRQWGALDGWLVEDSADLSLVEAVRRAATEWEASARGAEFIVHTGARLATAEQLANEEKFSGYLTSVDRAYLAAARASENASRARARSLRLGLGIAAAVIGVILVAGLTAGWFIFQAGEVAKREATANFQLARAEEALRGGRAEEAAAAALAAYELLPTSQTRTAALTAGMAISPHTVAVVPIAQPIRGLWWTGEGGIEAFDKDSLLSIALHSNDKAAVSVVAPLPAMTIGVAPTKPGGHQYFSFDGSIRVDSGDVVAGASDNGAFSFSALASPDGRQVLFFVPQSDPFLRDCREPPCRDRYLPGFSRATPARVAFKPDGTALALIGPLGTDLFVYRDGANEPLRTKLRREATTVAWGLGEVVVTGGPEGIDALDLSDEDVYGVRIGNIVQGDLNPAVIAISPIDGTVAVPCDRINICLSVPRATPGARHNEYVFDTELFGHNRPVNRLAFSSDGTLLLSFDDATLRVWSRQSDERIVFAQAIPAFSLPREHPPAAGLAIDRERHVWAAPTRDRVYLSGPSGEGEWFADDRVSDGQSTASSLAFLRNGSLAVAYKDFGVAVWSPGKAVPDTFIQLENVALSRLAAMNGDVRVAVLLSDKSILTLSGDDLHQGRLPPDPTAPLDQWGIAAAREGDVAYISYSDGSIRRRNLKDGSAGTVVYDASKPVCAETPTTDNNGALSLDVSSDGKWLAATRTDDRMIVHNLQDPSHPLCFALPAPDSKTVAFSPDASQLAVLTATDKLYVLDLNHSDAAIFGLSPITANSGAAIHADVNSRLTSWLAWHDDRTLAVSTAAGTVEFINLDPAAWRARVDSLTFTQ